jgi:ABC-type multidrug transport system fused ATPase/permease subunit
VILIAHRLATLRKANRIFALKDGEIVESGTHDELLGLEGGLYARLWSMQSGGANA